MGFVSVTHSDSGHSHPLHVVLLVAPIFLAILSSPDQSFVFAVREDKSDFEIALLEPILLLLIFAFLEKRRLL